MNKLEDIDVKQKVLILKLSPKQDFTTDVLGIITDLPVAVLQEQSWHLAQKTVDKIEYGLVLYHGICQAVVKLGAAKPVDDVALQFPELQIVSNINIKIAQWQPLWLNVLIGHAFDYSTSNRASVTTIDKLVWAYKLNAINDGYWLKMVKPELFQSKLKDAGQQRYNQLKLQTDAARNKLKKSFSHESFQSSVYVFNKSIDMYLDWILVKNWMTFREVLERNA